MGKFISDKFKGKKDRAEASLSAEMAEFTKVNFQIMTKMDWEWKSIQMATFIQVNS